MKFSLIAALIVVLALGTESASLVKRASPELSAEVEKITKYFQEIADKLKAIQTPELADKAKTYFEESRAQFQPMVEKLQEQLKPLSGNIEEQIKPLAASMHAQFEDMLKFMIDQTKAILPPQ